MTALLPAEVRSAFRRNHDAAQRLMLGNISWPTYQTITQALAEKPVRVTYDRGALELMVLSTAHERFKSLIGLIVCILAEELNRVIGSFGSFTHQREDLARALEPDHCFYLSHFSAVRGKREIDLTRDPPPDLAIEIEVSRSILDRLSILAALKVPEVWRFDGERLRVLLLKKGRYVKSRRSPSFPEISIEELPQFVLVGEEEGDVAMMQALRKWVRGLEERRRSKRKK